MRILKKINNIRQPNKSETQKGTSIRGQPTEGQKDLDLEQQVERIRKKEKLVQEKKANENDKMLVKLKLEEYTNDPKLATKESVMKLINMCKNRGMKQRIKKRFPRLFKTADRSNSAPVKSTSSFKRDDKSDGTKQPKDKQSGLGKRPPNPIRVEEDKILKQIKQKKKSKARREDTDRLDVLETQYKTQLQKKNKWSSVQHRG